MTLFFTISINNIFSVFYFNFKLILGTILRKKSMVFVYTAMEVLCVEHANVLELCYIELLSCDGSPSSILSVCTICDLRFTCVHHCMPEARVTNWSFTERDL